MASEPRDSTIKRHLSNPPKTPTSPGMKSMGSPATPSIASKYNTGPFNPFRTPSSKVYWSDDVQIDPNIFFGTADVSNVNSMWSRVRTPTHDVTRVRTPSHGPHSGSLENLTSTGQKPSGRGRWGKGLSRIGSVSGWKVAGGGLGVNSSDGAVGRRGTLLIQSVSLHITLMCE